MNQMYCIKKVMCSTKPSKMKYDGSQHENKTDDWGLQLKGKVKAW